MVGITGMIALVEPATDAEEIARCTLSAAELDICLHFDDHVIKSSAQVLYSRMVALKSRQIAI
jgi:hypothetical protein